MKEDSGARLEQSCFVHEATAVVHLQFGAPPQLLEDFVAWKNDLMFPTSPPGRQGGFGPAGLASCNFVSVCGPSMRSTSHSRVSVSDCHLCFILRMIRDHRSVRIPLLVSAGKEVRERGGVGKEAGSVSGRTSVV